MTSQGVRQSQNMVHQAKGPGKAGLADVGLVLGGPAGRPFPDSRLKGGPVQ
jgi:hypothetical protein